MRVSDYSQRSLNIVMIRRKTVTRYVLVYCVLSNIDLCPRQDGLWLLRQPAVVWCLKRHFYPTHKGGSWAITQNRDVRYTGIRKTAVLKVTVLYAVGWLNTSVYRLAALTASIFFHGHNIYLTILSICNDDVMKYGRISVSRYRGIS